MKTKSAISRDKLGLDICKGCLEIERNLNLISDKKLKRSFLNLTKLNISEKSALLLCLECVKMVKKFQDFRRMCGRVDKIIKEYNKNIKNGYLPEDILEHKKHLKLQQREIKSGLNLSNVLTIDVCCTQNTTHTRVTSYSIDYASSIIPRNYSEDMKIIQRSNCIKQQWENLKSSFFTENSCNDNKLSSDVNETNDAGQGADVDIKTEDSPSEIFNDDYILSNEIDDKCDNMKCDDCLEEFDDDVQKYKHTETCCSKILINNSTSTTKINLKTGGAQCKETSVDDRGDKHRDISTKKQKQKRKLVEGRKNKISKMEFISQDKKDEEIIKLDISDKSVVHDEDLNVEGKVTLDEGSLLRSNFVCNVCHKIYPTLCKLTKHQRHHSDLRPHACTQCQKTFKHKYQLKTHMTTHTGLRAFVCDQCGKSYTSFNTLRTHQLTHGAAKRFECEYCSKKFLRKMGLVLHVRTHTGEKNYICDYCAKAFAIERNLVAHRRIHLGIRPYSCPVCDRRFTESGSVKSHMRLHTGEKPFTCKSCDFSFRTSSDLHAHEMIHTGARPHKCDLCSYTARKAYNLKKHKLTHAKHSQINC